MNKILIVVDMQNDFVTGSLGTDEAQAIVPKIAHEIKLLGKYDRLFFTRDTHGKNYLETQEGKNLPIEHCIVGTFGHQIVQPLLGLRDGIVVDKQTFGTRRLAKTIRHDIEYKTLIDYEIHLVGVCTDICIVSNALLLKSEFPEVKMVVHADMCAGVTPESHKAALEVMKSCQIEVVGEEND